MQKCNKLQLVVGYDDPWALITGTWGTRPQNVEWETLLQIVPTNFVIFQNSKDHAACITFTMQKM